MQLSLSFLQARSLLSNDPSKMTKYYLWLLPFPSSGMLLGYKFFLQSFYFVTQTFQCYLCLLFFLQHSYKNNILQCIILKSVLLYDVPYLQKDELLNLDVHPPQSLVILLLLPALRVTARKYLKVTFESTFWPGRSRPSIDIRVQAIWQILNGRSTSGRYISRIFDGIRTKLLFKRNHVVGMVRTRNWVL